MIAKYWFKKSYWKDEGDLLPSFAGMYAFGIWFNDCIKGWIGQDKDASFCHVERQFGPPYNNISFSSVEDEGGVRFKKIDYSNPQRWVCLRVPITQENEMEDYKLAVHLKTESDDYKEQHGLKSTYDWDGIIGTMALPLGLQNPKLWWCSEIVGRLAPSPIREKCELSPTELYNRLLPMAVV